MSKQEAREVVRLLIGRRFERGAWAGAVLLLGLIAFMWFAGVRSGIAYIAPAVVACILVAMPHFRLLALTKSFGVLTEPITRHASDDGIESFTESSATNANWSAFRAYRKQGDVVLVYSAAHPKMAYPFVKRLFGDEAEWSRFLELLRRKLPSL